MGKAFVSAPCQTWGKDISGQMGLTSQALDLKLEMVHREMTVKQNNIKDGLFLAHCAIF